MFDKLRDSVNQHIKDAYNLGVSATLDKNTKPAFENVVKVKQRRKKKVKGFDREGNWHGD